MRLAKYQTTAREPNAAHRIALGSSIIHRFNIHHRRRRRRRRNHFVDFKPILFACCCLADLVGALCRSLVCLSRAPSVSPLVVRIKSHVRRPTTLVVEPFSLEPSHELQREPIIINASDRLLHSVQSDRRSQSNFTL